MDNKQRIKDLEKIIKTLDTAFEKGNDCVNCFTQEVVLDNEYDSLKTELFKLAPNSKIFKTVTASKIKTGENKVVHDPPMTSIHKCNGDEIVKNTILYKWIEDCKKVIPLKDIPKDLNTFIEKCFSVSFKIDGIAVSCKYENGILLSAGLRSKSGKDGINVTEKTRYIKGIPQKLSLPLTCVIRGEVETTISEFKKQCEKLGDKEKKANPRAHTAGSMNVKKAEQMKDRGLSFTAYNILKLKDPPYTTEIERAEWATRVLKLNFVKTVPLKIKTLEIFEDQHRKLNSLIDGSVISVNNLEYQEQLGNTSDRADGNPKGKIAWKFKDEVKKTTVLDVVWQTGRTGNICPVLIVDPILLEGTTVQKCTAHNLSIIQNEKIGIGTKIEIIKSGKIIPKLHKVIEAKGKLNIPDKCPSCGLPAEVKDGNNDSQSLACNNSGCAAQNIKSFNHYFKSLNVKGIAEKSIEKICEANLIKETSDFYKLNTNDLFYNGFAIRSAILVIARIWMISAPEQEKDNNVLKDMIFEEKREKIKIPLNIFFSSLGISEAGKNIGQILADEYENFEQVRNLTTEKLESTENIGPVSAKNICSYFEENKEKINNLLEYIEVINKKKPGGKLSGKSFCLSGTMDLGKSFWKSEIEKAGAVCKSGVSKKIDYVVAGSGSGLKSEKAISLGVPILTEEELEEMLRD